MISRRMKHFVIATGLALAAVPAAAQDGCRQHYDVVTGRVYGCGEDTGGRYPYRPSQPATKAVWASVFDGHLNDAITRAAKLLTETDPVQDEETYWQASSTLVEIFQELENDAYADKMLDVMIQKKIGENRPLRRMWRQYYLGRDLVRLGHREQGEQILRALTEGDERQVFIPAQRLGAIFMSWIEFDRGNIDQSAIWMRRAVIGILISNDPSPLDILDVLTEYAFLPLGIDTSTIGCIGPLRSARTNLQGRGSEAQP